MKTITLTLLLAFSATLSAQEPWTLERCIRHGLEHNPDIRAQRLEISGRQLETTRKTLAHLPVAGISLARDYNWGRSVDMQELVIIRNQLTRASGIQLQASVALFEGFTRHLNRLAARQSAETAAIDAEELARTLTLDITRAYLQLMLAGQISTCTQENYATIVRQRDRTAQLVEAGSQPQSALNEMQAQVATEKAAMVEAACRVRTARLALMRLLNLPSEEPFAVEGPSGDEQLPAGPPAVSAVRLEDGVCRDPRIRSARSAIEEMRYRHAADKGSLLPGLSLAAGYGTYYSSAADGSLRTQLDENRNPSLSFRLEIPVFHAGDLLIRVKRSRLDLERARLNAEKMKQQVEDEIRSTAIEAENCCQKVLSAEETLHAMQDLLAIMEARYNLGAATAVDYITARNQHFKATSDYLQAKWQYLFQLKLLEQYKP